MSFLQPILLAGLPLVALPIVIHLINQRRYQTIRWGAMMFLLAANRMSRGYAKLRQWLILLFRMLAIAGLVFTISRPLATGWLGLSAGGRADTTIILLDRSPSMGQQGYGSVGSKLDTGRQQLSRTLSTLGAARWVLIESTTNQPRELESPGALLNLPSATGTSASADVPAMLEVAREYIRTNKVGRTEIWICSDIRRNDWNDESGRWQTLRDSFLEFSPGIRFHLLAYPQGASDNVSIRVTDVERRQAGDSAELLVSLHLTQETTPTRQRGTSAARLPGDEDPSLARRVSVPILFEIDGARSELTIEMAGSEFHLKDHRIPLDLTHQRGWGRVSIPADSNPADNDYYFVFDQPPLRRTAVIAEDVMASRPLQLAAAIAPDPALRNAAEVISPEQLGTMDWNELALVLWQAPLPDGEVEQAMRSFVERGGQVMFFPPRAGDDAEFLGASWGAWSDSTGDIVIESWRGDQDLLANTQSGAALPLGQLQVRRYRQMAGELTPLATLKGGSPLVARVPTPRGGVYFCATTVASDSSLASSGVVLYIFVQRALATGAAVLGNTRQLVAGDPAAELPSTWRQIAGPADAISTEFAWHGGVYESDERLLAVNRAADEDHAPVLTDHRVADLFQGLDFARVDDQAGSLGSLIQEIWRLFLAAMIVALLVEAALCLPILVRRQR
jgi:hypothetical protein